MFEYTQYAKGRIDVEPQWQWVEREDLEPEYDPPGYREYPEDPDGQFRLF